MSLPLKSERHYRPLTGAELGALIAMAAFGMLFGTLFLTYLLARARLPVWPPIGVEPVGKILPTLSTVSLLASSYFVRKSSKEVSKMSASLAPIRKLWRWGIFFGFAFLVLQIFFWRGLAAQGLHANSNLFGGIFYAMTGVHAFHVVFGLLALVWVERRVFNHLALARWREAPKLASWMWDFLDAIWIIMYVMLVWI